MIIFFFFNFSSSYHFHSSSESSWIINYFVAFNSFRFRTKRIYLFWFCLPNLCSIRIYRQTIISQLALTCQFAYKCHSNLWNLILFCDSFFICLYWCLYWSSTFSPWICFIVWQQWICLPMINKIHRTSNIRAMPTACAANHFLISTKSNIPMSRSVFRAFLSVTKSCCGAANSIIIQ